ncbi:MAG: AAA family ATPase [Phycisphaerales bacterium]|nr:AAA family ATPase [Phycisphaerales bacterium]
MHDDLQAVESLRSGYQRLRSEMAKVIVGQEEVLEQLFIALFAGGHCILEGVPGLAKTLMISTLARCLDLTFNRVQFTPDLMPSDITGTEVIQEDKASGTRMFKFLPGPIFANVILADEINRTPPKTQAALLEAMQERHVTVGGTRHDLPGVFFVLATQNPIEQEGTYPLPEAQQDRFMFKVNVGYPSYKEEYCIAERTTSVRAPQVERIFDSAQITGFQDIVRRVPAAPDVLHYALRLARATRPDDATSAPIVREMVTWGAGPRAVQGLILGGKARAIIKGRHHVAAEDVAAVAGPVMRHRLVLNYSAESEGYTTDRLIAELVELIDPNETPVTADERFQKVLSA